MKVNKITMIMSEKCSKCKTLEKRLKAVVEKNSLKADFKLLPVGEEAAKFAITWGLESIPSVLINSKPFDFGKDNNLSKFTDEQFLKAMKK